MTTAQKIGIALALLLVVAYLGVQGARENGFQALRNRITGDLSSSVSPTASASPGVLAMPSETTSPTATPTAATVSTIATTAEVSVLATMNTQRQSAGIGDCIAHSTLQTLAQNHASDMARRGYFSHTDPDGVTFEQRIIGSGYGGALNAENLGLTSGQSAEVVAGWMESASHRANLLNPQFTACGIGVASGTWQGMPVSFVVAIFGNAK